MTVDLSSVYLQLHTGFVRLSLLWIGKQLLTGINQTNNYPSIEEIGFHSLGVMQRPGFTVATVVMTSASSPRPSMNDLTLAVLDSDSLRLASASPFRSAYPLISMAPVGVAQQSRRAR